MVLAEGQTGRQDVKNPSIICSYPTESGYSYYVPHMYMVAITGVFIKTPYTDTWYGTILLRNTFVALHRKL